MIHKMLKDGLSKSAIARKLGIARDTVIKYSKLPEGYMPVIKREVCETTVDPYLPNIAMILEEAHKLDVHVPTASDWVEFPKDGLSAFVATMGYSRASYVEYVTDEKVDTLIKCHMNAFSYFGGVPTEGLYDNMKTVIIKRNVYGYAKHKFNEQFRDFAEKHCGMKLRVCKPYRAQTKGKVERFNHYLRYSFHNSFKVRLSMMGYKMNVESANAEVMDWLDFTANARVLSTTLHKPFDLLAEEQLQLLPLPKPYQGIHPIKATAQSVTQDSKSSERISIHIPQRDLQSYDEFIPTVALMMLPTLEYVNNTYYTGGALWN